MINIVNGNILNSTEDIIIHQVNVFGSMRTVELQDNSPTAMKI